MFVWTIFLLARQKSNRIQTFAFTEQMNSNHSLERYVSLIKCGVFCSRFKSYAASGENVKNVCFFPGKSPIYQSKINYPILYIPAVSLIVKFR